MSIDNWQSLGEITARIIPKIISDRLTPVGFSVLLQGPLAAAVKAEATKAGTRPETLIAEAVRAYMGDAA